jgi:hypothetical protein
MSISSILVRQQDGVWRVEVDGEVVTVHASGEEARRSADILAERIGESGRGQPADAQ